MAKGKKSPSPKSPAAPALDDEVRTVAAAAAVCPSWQQCLDFVVHVSACMRIARSQVWDSFELFMHSYIGDLAGCGALGVVL
jgi:hypothetical protein